MWEQKGRILDCYAGSRAWGIPSGGDRRNDVAAKLRAARARSILDIQLKKLKPYQRLRIETGHRRPALALGRPQVLVVDFRALR
jgi:hypothetical protein